MKKNIFIKMGSLFLLLFVSLFYYLHEKNDSKIDLSQAFDATLEKEDQNINLNQAGSRGIASVPALGSSRFSGRLKITPVVSEIEICKLKFSSISYASSDARFIVQTQNNSIASAPFSYPWPKDIRDLKSAVQGLDSSQIDAPSQIQLKYPVMPNLPILSTEATPQAQQNFCQDVVRYHQKAVLDLNMKKNKFHSNSKNKLIQSSDAVAVSFSRRPQRGDEGENFPPPDDSGGLGGGTQGSGNTGSTPPADLATLFEGSRVLVFYDDKYATEMTALKFIYAQLGYDLNLIALSKIPGINGISIPRDCAGGFMNECYFDSSTQTMAGVNPEQVSSLKGFVEVDGNSEQKNLIPYVPGLIRAEIRRQKRDFNLAGVLLVGHSQKLASYFYPTSKYEHNTYDSVNMPMGFLNTDLMYMLPDLELTATNQTHFTQYSTFIWACRNTTTSLVTMREYCLDNEVRHLEMAKQMSSHRYPPRFPAAPVFRFKNLYSLVGNYGLFSVQEKDIIPVGRIVTQNDFYEKDPIVSNYLKKIIKWHSDLPPFKDSSVASYGGTPSDYWVFLDSDVSTFKTVYGDQSKQYASEFFVPLSQCLGVCSYKSGTDVFKEMATSKNRVSFMMTGHGSHSRAQSTMPNTYATTDAARLNYHSDQAYGSIYGDIHLTHFTTDKMPTTGFFKNRSLIGHVLANSCYMSDINFDDGFHQYITQMDPKANQRSIGEQFIQVENGGAMNVLFNSDVGWGYTDNKYNQQIMLNVEKANKRCGTMGDAYRLTVLDMIRGNSLGAGDWQLINRQFLGSPVNMISRQPSYCLDIMKKRISSLRR